MTGDEAPEAALEAIAVIGMSCRFPGAPDLGRFWEVLRDGVECISPVSDEDLAVSRVDPAISSHPRYVRAAAVLEGVDQFDHGFFGFTPREAEVVDPAHRLFLECAWEALEAAGCDPDRFKGRIGIYAGAAASYYLIYNITGDRELGRSVNPVQLLTSSDKDYLPTLAAYKLNLTGPSVGVQTACSSGLVAVNLASQSLMTYQCDMAVVGDAAVRVPQRAGYVYIPGGIQSPDGSCRAFDAAAAGTIFGSGVGVVVLRRLSDALAAGDPILAVIRGSAVNNDGAAKSGFTAPSARAQAEVIALALAMADIGPETIGYVETHGTATPLGDSIEVAALEQVFRGRVPERSCALGSVKTNIGHADTAAGMAALIKTVLAMQQRQIPASLHFERPNPQIDFARSPFYVNARLAPWPAGRGPRRAGVNSFGIGGTNAHVIVEEAPAAAPSGPARAWQVLPLSARSAPALEAMGERLSAHLRQHPEAAVADVAYTLQVGRKRFAHRRIVLCQDAAQAVRALAGEQRELVASAVGKPGDAAVVFVFPGQGSLYVGMGRGLHDSEAAFREALDSCAKLLLHEIGNDLRALLYPEPGRQAWAAERLAESANAQPALFAVEYALAKMWLSWGVRPAATIGHGSGEQVAACLAGTLALRDALALVAARGRQMAAPPRAAGAEAGAGLDRLAAEPGQVQLEVGPATSYGGQPRLSPGRAPLPSLKHANDSRDDLALALGTLGNLWLSGADVDWQAFHRGERRHRVPLPAYPFERQRCWFDPGAPPAPSRARGAAAAADGNARAGGAAPDVADWFHLPVWKQSMAPASIEPGRAAERWLIFQDAGGLGAAAAALLRRAGHGVTTVEIGDALARRADDAWVVDPGRRQDYQEVLTTLAAADRLPTHLLHLWCVTGSADPGAQALLSRGFGGLLLLAQALGEAGRERPLRLAVVADRLWSVTGEELLQPEKAALLGPARVIPWEYPGLSCRVLDVAPPAQAEARAALAERLVAELTGNHEDRPVAYRGDRRWLQVLEPVRLAAHTSSAPALRRRGSYLITGGLGTVGSTLAEFLARSVQARLTLVGRSPFPAREEWQEQLQRRDRDDPVARRIRRIQELEAAGAEVLVVSADVTDAEQARQAVRRCEEAFGALHGVIHGAGVAAPGLLQRKTMADADAVMAPKIAGTRHLAAATGGMALDFFVLLASASSLGGAPGTVDACAADAFLDAFAEAESARGRRVLAIAWAPWEAAPAAADDEEPRIPPADGSEAFRRVLEQVTVPRVVISPGDPGARRQRPGATRSGAARQVRPAHPRPALANPYAPPRHDVEREIARLWQEALGFDRVGVDDNFFELGGQSLLAIHVLHQVCGRFAVELPISAAFEAPTVARLAEVVGAQRGAAADHPGLRPPPLLPRAAGGDAPLSFQQLRLWFVDQLESGSSFYNLSTAVRLGGRLEVAVLKAALAEVARRHAVLRTTFPLRGREPVQVIRAPGRRELPLVDLGALPEPRRPGETRRLAAGAVRQVFELSRGPLWQCCLVRLDGRHHAIVATLHHIVADGRSIQLLIHELAVLYDACRRGLPSPLPELTIQYADFAAWQRRWLIDEALDTQLAYWRRRLAGSPPLLELPLDHPRPAVQRFDGARVDFALPAETVRGLRDLARRQGCTAYMALLACFQTLLCCATGAEDVLVGSNVGYRNWPETQGMIGFFANMLVLRSDLSGNPTLLEVLGRVRLVALEAFAHPHLPFEKLVEELRPARSLAYNPLVQVTFELVDWLEQEAPSADLEVSPLRLDVERSQFDLSLTLSSAGSALLGRIEYKTSLLARDTVQQLAEQLEMVMAQMESDPGQRVGDVAKALAAANRRRLHDVSSNLKESNSLRLRKRLRRAEAGGGPGGEALPEPGSVVEPERW